MTQGIDVKDGYKFKVLVSDRKYYFTIGNSFIIFSGPNEGAPENATVYSLINALCRVASRSRNAGMTWGQIAYQIKAGSAGVNTVTEKIAKSIARYLQKTCPDWWDTEPGQKYKEAITEQEYGEITGATEA